MEDESSFRVSPQQEQLWVDEPDGPTGAIQAVIELEGAIDPATLRVALERVVQRHEILRTTFSRRAGIRVPLQVIHDTLAPRWRTTDLGGLTGVDRAVLIEAELEEALRRPSDYEQGPLVDGLLLDGGDGQQILVITLPLLCADGASVPVLLDELVALASGRDVPGEPLQYADFSEWQHEQESATDEAAVAARTLWQRALDTPAARLPLSRRASTPSVLKEVPLNIDEELAAGITAGAARYGTPAEVFIHAAWHAFLSRVTGETELVVVTLNAAPRHPDLEGAVGLIGRPLPIRIQLSGELTFAELIDQVDRGLANAAVHQDWAPTKGIAPAFGVVARPSFEAAANGVRFSLTRICDRVIAPMTLAYESDPDHGIRLALVLDHESIATEHAEMLAAQFERLLRSAVADPGAAIGQLQLLGNDDVRFLIETVNETAAETPDIRVHELFELRAAETPDATAVSDGTDSLTYANLDARANQLARRLRELGVGAGDVVALSTDRSVELAVGVLGILKAGAAYLPLNQDHPLARLEHQMTESGAQALVSQERLLDLLPRFEHVVCLDRDRPGLDALDPGGLQSLGGPDELAYIIYTSGSTGAPKGVSIAHRSLSNYVHDIVRRLGAIGAAYTFGMVSAISTDLGNTAFFPALCSGGTLSLIKPEVAVDPGAFARQLEGSPLDVLKITPSHLSALLSGNDSRLLPRQWLILGGEKLAWDLVDRVQGLTKCQVMNHYGPTETTIGSCTMLVEDSRGSYESATVPIGGPISNTRCYVLDDRLQPVPLDVAGRLFIGGIGVARGYIGRPDLTAERFLPDPFAASEARMYDTGDLVRRLPDGVLEFLGRTDEQLKIRGFRVEPSEIEAALRRHPAVENAAVIAAADSPDDLRLVAYCVLGAPASADVLSQHVGKWVPDFMVPSAFVILESLPLSASGKIDRLALSDLAQPSANGDSDYVAPRTALEEAVAAIWAEVLGLERVSVDADFFALGGHSLLATQVVAQVRSDFAIELPLHSLFVHPTVALLSEEIFALMGGVEHGETAKLLAELEELSDAEARRLVGDPEQHI